MINISRRCVLSTPATGNQPLSPSPQSPIYQNLSKSKQLAIKGGFLVDESGALIHRSEWENHVGSIPHRWVVIHKDRDKENNDISNLACLPQPVANQVLNYIKLGANIDWESIHRHYLDFRSGIRKGMRPRAMKDTWRAKSYPLIKTEGVIKVSDTTYLKRVEEVIDRLNPKRGIKATSQRKMFNDYRDLICNGLELSKNQKAVVDRFYWHRRDQMKSLVEKDNRQKASYKAKAKLRKKKT